MSEWLPIDSAPKDAGPLDIWAVQWHQENKKTPAVKVGRRFADCEWRDREWVCVSHGLGILIEVEWTPTHWMPPPNPPWNQENANG